MPREARGITVSLRQRALLMELVEARSTPRGLAERAAIVLASVDGASNEEQAQRLHCARGTVRQWRARWADAQEALAAAEVQETDRDLAEKIRVVLSDLPRPGAPAKFTAEQLTAIISVACEKPEDCGVEGTHWTPPELAREVIKRKIVDSISPRHLDRFLNQADLRPHKSRYWLTSPDKKEDPQAYDQAVQALCATYLEAPALQQQGTHVISTDEKTGMQAIERKHPTLPTRPGLVERIEFEYIRHGTLCLTPSFNVTTGQIDVATISATRSEEDFAGHIEATVATDPAGRWIFVLDQLNTHMSESLVRLVAKHDDLTQELGVKGECGILKSKATRKAFLEDRSHTISFQYTPRNCSWLNQVEIWFGILSRRLLKRGSFTSLEDLGKKVEAFIHYFNAVLAKPYKWTYTGRPLVA